MARTPRPGFSFSIIRRAASTSAPRRRFTNSSARITAEGLAIVLTSDTLEETIGLSHSVFVMRDGVVTHRRRSEPAAQSRGRSTSSDTWSSDGCEGAAVRRHSQMDAAGDACGPHALGRGRPAELSRTRALLIACSDTAVLFILATGVTFVIMLGGIDLSIQSMASLASVIVALTVSRLGYGSFLFAIAIGAVAGLLSGIVHVRLKIPSFIATLAMGGVLFSAALVISKERSITLGRSGARLSDMDHRPGARRAERHCHRPDRPGGRPYRCKRIRGSAATAPRSARGSLRLTPPA